MGGWRQLLERWAGAADRLTTRQAVLLLLAADLLVTVPFMAALQVDADPGREERTDLILFRDRASTILAGDWLYRDTDHTTLTPPVINYLMVVPVLAGDHVVAWEAYFALWSFAVAAVLYGCLRGLHRGLAFAVALAYVTSPFSYATAVLMVQDDTVVPFFLALVMASLLANHHVRAGLWSGLGTMVKAWPGVAAPIVFLAAPGRQRLRVAAVGAGVAVAISLPFLLVVPEGYLPFLRFYLLGQSPDGDFEGLSLWRFLWLQGLGVPQGLNLGVLLLALVLLWWRVLARRIDALPALAISYSLLFVLYPKLHFGYYLLGLLVVLPWAATRWRRLVGLLAAAVAARVAHLHWRQSLPLSEGGVLVATALAAALVVYWAWWARTLWRDGDFRVLWRHDAARGAAPALAVGLVQMVGALASAAVMAAVRATT